MENNTKKLKENKVRDLVIENQWLNGLVAFIKKAYEIDDKTFNAYVNGTKPEFSKEQAEKLDTVSFDLIEQSMEAYTEYTEAKKNTMKLDVENGENKTNK